MNAVQADKYNYFKMHKWVIIKAIKEKELKLKMKRNAKRRLVKGWVIM